jgi:predicted nucleic acid-binding protein
MPENNTCFIDTNVWLYALLDTGKTKKSQAAQALIKTSEAIVSTQVVNEVCANLIKKANIPEEEIRKFMEGTYAKHRVVDIVEGILLTASQLRTEYSLSYWDSVIVAAALEAGVNTLYSEDLQDDLLIRKALRMVNPFR